ncbi:unnamed protein product [Prorocentrum cordatum]|uniref:SUI1 domain-containing protein n=1 Tax=Prorocentrum cordatum TaxID=2364126 RepID=A0ABN9UZ97_9DINO|nr:unnamed protein product [Polarella glacialis]
MAALGEKFDASGGFSGKDDGRSKVHIRMQQRNGRKSWTTVQGFPEQVRLPKTGRVLPVHFEKILQHLKKTFKTNGTLIKDEEHGTIPGAAGRHPQGGGRVPDRRHGADLQGSDQVMIHGS